MSDREWNDGKTRWLTGVEAEVFASTQSLKRAISMMKARQLETDCDVDEAEWLNTDIDRLSQLIEKERGRLEGAPETEWVKCSSCGNFAYECDVCGGKPTPPQEQ